MRLIVLLIVAAAVIPAPARAQDPEPSRPVHELLTLDPNKPSDAALLRDFGDTLVAQVPVADMQALDPYKPSDAALLRRMGAGLPIYLAWYPLAFAPTVAAPMSDMPLERRMRRASGAMPYPVAPRPNDCACDREPASGPTSVATILKPQSNDGVWIEFQEQRWISAGKTVPHVETDFVSAGTYRDLTVYKRRSSSDEVIYLPTRDGSLAPYRLKER